MSCEKHKSYAILTRRIAQQLGGGGEGEKEGGTALKITIKKIIFENFHA